jgi:nitroimidazol reductase NimA-like FMN-containing flavoprotein (pyridoxamine 5'-phosphate oxidase superfamily)
VGEDVVFPAVRGGEVDMAVCNAVVAFEADHIDPLDGWSVVVTGVATEVDDPATVGLLEARVALHPRPGEEQRLYSISTRVVSGRRLLRPALHIAGTASATIREPEAAQIPFPGGQSEPLSVDECLAHLTCEQVGRLVLVVDGQPRVFPVNYALDGDAVVFRTAPGTKLHTISRSLAVFEVDHWGPSEGSGWSVVVEGLAQEITSADAPGLRQRPGALPLRPWAAGDRHHFVRILPLTITGYRVRSPVAADAPQARALDA